MPLTSVFQFLSRMRKTGTLHIKLGDEDVNIELADGCVESTMTSRSPASERIGNLLVEHGFVKREDVEEFLLRQGNKKKKLGLLGMELIRAKMITHAQLQDGLELQARRRIRRICKAKVATYEFLDGRRSRGGHIRIRLSLQPTSK